jgi:hypothetical protein
MPTPQVWHNPRLDAATLPDLWHVYLQTGSDFLVSAYKQYTKPLWQCYQTVGRKNEHSSLLQHYISLNNSWTFTRDI